MGWPNNYVQGVYNALGSLIGIDDGAGGQIGLASTYTWATKPLASAYIGTAFISDIGGGTYWVSNGTRWYPLNGRATTYVNPTDYTRAALTAADTSAAIAADDILFTIPVEAGMFLDLDLACLAIDTYHSSNAVAVGYKIYVSSTAGTLGTLLPIDISVANYRHYGYHKIQRLSSSSLRLIGGVGGVEATTGSGLAYSGAVVSAGLPSLDNKFYFQICPYHNGVGVNVDETFHYVRLELINKV